MTNTHSDDLVARLRSNHENKYPMWTIQGESADRIEELERENADLRHDIERHIGIATEANQEADTLAKLIMNVKDSFASSHIFKLNEFSLRQSAHAAAIAIANRRINGETE